MQHPLTSPPNQERLSTDTLNKRSFADRVQSAFNKVNPLAKDEEEPELRMIQTASESPTNFLKVNLESLKNQVNNQSKEKFVMRRETFGQDFKKEDMPAYSDYTSPSNNPERNITPNIGSPEDQLNQVVNKEHYERLAVTILDIFERRQKKFEVEFLLQLCMMVD